MATTATTSSSLSLSIPTTIEAPLSSPSLLSSSSDPLYERLRQEALETLEREPELCMLMHRTVLAKHVQTFEDAIVSTICHRLQGSSQQQATQQQMSASSPCFCPNALKLVFTHAIRNAEMLEHGHTMAEAVRLDVLAVLDRDPACHRLLEVVLFYKGFSALVCHRAARQKWILSNGTSMTALYLQSLASAQFGVDIHPGATIGAGVFLDHGTGIVIGETAWVGDGCTILHGVTLGGTGKESGDRHPKVGSKVLIGAGTSILGNITIGNSSKIGAGSIVLRSIPPFATAVGAPAKIIGRSLEADPASAMDDALQNVGLLHKSTSMYSTTSTATTAKTLETRTSDLSTSSNASITSEGSSSSSTSSNNDNDEEEQEEENDQDTLGKPGPRTTSTATIDDITASENQTILQNAKQFGNDDSNNNNHHHDQTNDNNNNNNKNTNHCNKQQQQQQRARQQRARQQRTKQQSMLCPFRAYRRMSNTAPKGSITICTLYKMFENEPGISQDDIGCAFFEMDTNNVGYVYCTDDNYQRMLSILKERLTTSTSLPSTSSNTIDQARIEQIVESYRAKHEKSFK